VTANNYQAADWSSRGMYGPSPRRTPPVVIDKQPDYGKINDIKWSGTGEDADSWAISGALGEIPDFLADIARPAIEYGLNLGKTHEITPGARDDDLKGMATAWRAAAGTVLKAGDNFTAAIDYMTDPQGYSEWQGAMKSFCQSIWGTTAWGRSRDAQGNIAQQGGRSWKTSATVAPAQRRPILEVLHHTADTVQKTCDDLAQVVRTRRTTTENLAKTAAKGMVVDLTTGLDPLELFKPPSPAPRTCRWPRAARGRSTTSRMNTSGPCRTIRRETTGVPSTWRTRNTSTTRTVSTSTSGKPTHSSRSSCATRPISPRHPPSRI
jgi:hypothetical protein